MVIDEKTYFAFVLALGDQFMDLQKNGNTYTERVKIDSYGHTAEINVSKYYNKAYHNILKLLNQLTENSDLKLIPYNGQWYTKEEIDKMFYRDIF